jgi:membrane peptidoglycan carboxypeptidase
VLEGDNTRPQGRQVIPQVYADTMNMVLKGAVESGTGVRARLPGREVAGKTGTTNDYGDARFVGYTPNLVTSVWLGFERPKEHKLINVRGLAGVSGGTLPAQIWHDFMDQATRDRPPDTFPLPAELGGQVLNPTTTAPPQTVPQTTQPPQNPGQPQPTLPPPTQPGPSLPPPTQPGVTQPTFRG